MHRWSHRCIQRCLIPPNYTTSMTDSEWHNQWPCIYSIFISCSTLLFNTIIYIYIYIIINIHIPIDYCRWHLDCQKMQHSGRNPCVERFNFGIDVGRTTNCPRPSTALALPHFPVLQDASRYLRWGDVYTCDKYQQFLAPRILQEPLKSTPEIVQECENIRTTSSARLALMVCAAP